MVSEIHNWSILPRIAFTIFTNHGSIYRKTTAKAWKWYQTGFEEMEHEFHPEKQVKEDYLFRCSVTRWHFVAGATQKVVLHLLSSRIIRKMAPDYLCKLISRRKSTGYSLRSRKKLCLRFQAIRYSQHLVVEHSVTRPQSSGTTYLAKYPAWLSVKF